MAGLSYISISYYIDSGYIHRLCCNYCKKIAPIKLGAISIYFFIFPKAFVGLIEAVTR